MKNPKEKIAGWVCWHEACWGNSNGQMDYDTIWEEKPRDGCGCRQITERELNAIWEKIYTHRDIQALKRIQKERGSKFIKEIISINQDHASRKWIVWFTETSIDRKDKADKIKKALDEPSVLVK